VNVAALRAMDAEAYVPHELHRAGRLWGESNCYVDLWIEVLHALGCEPVACLPFVLGIDWEGDQFTFLKPPCADLVDLYGVEAHELNVYRPLLENAKEQIRVGRLVLAEVDSFYLPDTASTDYRSQHTKTTIGIQEIDAEARSLGYFHNSGYHRLAGEDFVDLFRLEVPCESSFMPFFAELVRTARVVRLRPEVLVARSVTLLKTHLARRPAENPVARFAETFPSHFARLRKEGMGSYHPYAFATVRQLGSAFELIACYLRWLASNGETGLETCAAASVAISEGSKSLLLKLARAVTVERDVDLGPMLGDIARSWDVATKGLADRYDVV
jgi:hypothetical protein